jgi:PEP-CTERM motif-containing protein
MKKGFSLLLLAGLASFSTAARADTFVIDPAQSILTLSATFQGVAATQQPPAGFTTSYTGFVDATIGANTIQFNSASADANVSGIYQPAVGGGAGLAPGDYGGQFTIAVFQGVFSIRDLVASLASNSTSLTGGTFDAGALMFSILSGSTDYNVSALGLMGSVSMIGETAQNGSGVGSIAIVNGVETMTVPIDVTITLSAVNTDDTVIHLSGNIVAISAVPEPSTWALLICGGGVAWFALRRRQQLAS